MATVVNNTQALKKRLLRLLSFKDDQGNLDNFLSTVSAEGELFLFGGAIRDVALHGISSFSSDLDFVFDGGNTRLKLLLSDYDIEENKYGGFRINISGYDIDIWALEKTWAFQKQLVKYDSVESLLKTTITNWDSCLFSWNKKSLILSENYLNDLRAGFLDVVLKENPNELGMLVRVLRCFALKEANKFSNKLIDLVFYNLQEYSVSEILDYERMSYEKIYISRNIISYLKEVLHPYFNGILPIELDKFYKNKELFS